ncbi:hypothetical protein SEA_OBLADI_166 [Gordonia phage ObLaDi]|uniref:Uncharacterized protein n=3 Tax=Cafassovirus TaxID=3425056 RepID=A0A9E7TVK3_9CAUD|nr:hypothetical protein SEA_CAFASSO_168 [Gordonia phage Cafasso]UVK59903.1 hypothetical protein SEA_ALEEMILY_164 [Gordonia phage Aleemily]UXE03889.1 hypothetical protein SEA_OBLADI_166 [Gordonia phage ObLaDi]
MRNAFSAARERITNTRDALTGRATFGGNQGGGRLRNAAAAAAGRSRDS